MRNKKQSTPVERSATRRPFGRRLLVYMALLSLGPLVVMAYQGYHCARQAIIELQEVHLRSLLELEKARISSWVNGVEADMRLLAFDPCLRGECGTEGGMPTIKTDPQTGMCQLYDAQRHLSVFTAVAIFDRSGKRMAAACRPGGRPLGDGLLRMVDTSPQQQGFRLLSGKPGAGFPDRLFALYPVEESDGQPGGTVMGSLDIAASLRPLLALESGLGSTGKVYLVSPDRQRIIAPQPVRQPEDLLRGLPSAILSPGTSVVTGYVDYRHRNVLGISTRLPRLGWTLVVEEDQAEVFKWLSTLKIRAVLTGLVTLVLALFVAVASARRLSRPLNELARVSRRIASGRHDDRLGPMEGAEAQDVSRAFNHMLDELEASQRRLIQTASLAAVGELSSSIVHEIRNPLSSVKMNLQALRRKVGDDPAHSELADIATTQVQRIEHMLADLLNFAKPLSLSPEDSSFADLVRALPEVVRSNLESAEVTLEIDDRTGGERFRIDREQLLRALTNLVVNAIQVSPAGARVTVSGEIAVDDTATLRVRVADDGPGISDRIRDKLFQPFFTTRDGGTGLGLANVRKIVEYHNGRVGVANRPTGGAVFELDIPVRHDDTV